MPAFFEDAADRTVAVQPVSSPEPALRYSIEKPSAFPKTEYEISLQNDLAGLDEKATNGVKPGSPPLQNGHRWGSKSNDPTVRQPVTDEESRDSGADSANGMWRQADGVTETRSQLNGRPSVEQDGDVSRTGLPAPNAAGRVTNGDGGHSAANTELDSDIPLASRNRDSAGPSAHAARSSQKGGSGDSSLRIPTSAHRLSSPPTFSPHPPSSSNHVPLTPTTSAPPPQVGRLQHRHTLEVPKLSTGRVSKDFSSANPSEDASFTSGRFSPTAHSRRRGSVTLGRKATRSINSDMHLDEVAQDDDAVRWAEHIRQKRASKRKRKDDEDDDRVVVGTKVDQNHVNWVTAYNMLTGIRFTVSRTNAKLDRDLTDADFEAKHKFSFDMWVPLRIFKVDADV